MPTDPAATNPVRELARLVLRERAVIGGILLAVVEAAANGEITKATAVPVIAGIVLRFFVSPATSGPPARLDQLDDAAQAALITQTDNSGPPDPVELPQTKGSIVDG